MFARRQAERVAVLVGIREVVDVRHQPRNRLLGVGVAHEAERARGHAVVAAVEREHAPVPGGGLRELQRGFDGVRAGRRAELHLRRVRERGRQTVEQRVDERLLLGCGDVERVQRAVLGEQSLQLRGHCGMVVAERERARAGQAVEVGGAVGVGHLDALGVRHRHRQRAWVGACVRFASALAFEEGSVRRVVVVSHDDRPLRVSPSWVSSDIRNF